jgi:3-oxoacyl-(acyl-carrier-protein) synthase
MNRGVIPHIHNLETCTFDDKNLLVRENMLRPAKRMLNNSFGFGGKNMAQVVEIC